MHENQFAGVLAALVSIAAFSLYIRSILRGETVPNRVTWFVWVVVGSFICASYFALGGDTAAYVTVVYVVGPFAVFILSIKKGEGGLNPLDLFCLTGAISGGILWAVYNSPMIALVMNIAMDFLGLVPTIVKSWKRPYEEDKFAWGLSTTSALINLFAVKEWRVEIYLYPVYCFIGIGLVYVILIWKRKTTKPVSGAPITNL